MSIQALSCLPDQCWDTITMSIQALSCLPDQCWDTITMSIQALSCLPDQCWDTITMSIQALSCLQTNAGTPSPCLYRSCPAFQTNAGTPSPCLYRPCPAFRPMLGHHHHVYTGPVLPSRPMLGHHHHVYTGPVLPSDQCWDTITMSIQALSCLQTNAGTPSPCLYRPCPAFRPMLGHHHHVYTGPVLPSDQCWDTITMSIQVLSCLPGFSRDRPTTYHPTHTLTARWPLQEANTGRY
ncbi:hypothetical protein ACOMHN_014375 [Nucella lapillus]